MVVFRSLKALIKDPKASKTFLTLTTFTSTTASTIPLPYFPLSNPLARPLFRFPCSTKWLFSPSFHGPLFLSFPPWKLSQSATPLYLQCKATAVVLRRALPITLGQADAVLHKVEGPKEPCDAFLDSFVNLPNFISMTRLLSGPVLGWYVPLSLSLSLSIYIYMMIVWLPGKLEQRKENLGL
jgi:cardiolipin synthase